MPQSMITEYLANIPAVIAERKILIAQGANWTRLQHPDEQMETWIKTAYGDIPRVAATPAVLAMIGIGVEHVAKPR